jgi:HEAT repeat protein
VHTYERIGPAQAGTKQTPFDRVQSELVLLQPYSTPALAQMLALKDGIVAFLGADTLKRIGAPALEHILPVLEDASPEVRRRAAHLLGELPNGGEREPALLESLGRHVAHDEAWIVRAEAAEALGARSARNAERGYAVAVLARALSDPDPAVAQSAARALESAGDARAIPILIRALEQAVRQGEPKSARGVQDALKKLTGETRDLEPEEWRAWLEKHPPTSKPQPR